MSVATTAITLLALVATAKPLPAQQPAGIERRSHSDGHVFTRSTAADHPAGDVGRAIGTTVADSTRDVGRKELKYAVIGGVLGAVVGAVVGNQYAQAHKPPCVNVPAGPPCRYLDPDNSGDYRGLGIGLGAGLGALIGILRAR